MISGIYKIENLINHKVYIGQSIDIKRRWKEHQRCKIEGWIHQAIKKYGLQNFDFSIIEECKPELLDEKEQFWIAHYNSFGQGYNQNAGGKTHSLYTAIETLKKEVTQYDFNGQIINTFCSTREAERATGILHIAEVCRHEREHAGGFVWRYSSDIFSKPKIRKRPVKQLDKQTLKVINIFPSIAEAAKATNSNASAIGAVCRGERISTNNYKWRYADE